jgi:hypothetical protein
MGKKNFNRQGSSAGDADIVYDDGPGREIFEWKDCNMVWGDF